MQNKMKTLSCVILTKNEEKVIKKCIKSVDFCDETIVIDDSSTDKTVEIGKELGAKVYKRGLENNYAKQRNFALKKAKGKWVLFVDADEIVPPELKSEIVNVINAPATNYLGYKIRRKDFLWGKELKHGEVGSVRLLRLARRKAGKWRRRVHEEWIILGRVGNLKSPLYHYPHPTLREFTTSVNRFSSLHAKANYGEGKRSNTLKILLWPILKFVRNYVFKLGFLDGMQGFMVAMIMSFHSFLAWGKLWMLQKNTQ
jgi:glycosyltransferase involved in cell wall biosynthesis